MAELHSNRLGGRLRVAIAISPAPGTFWAGRDPASGEPSGVAVDLGRALAGRLGASVDLVVYRNSGAITDAAPHDAWDVTFIPMDASRAMKLDFGPIYHVAESTFLVRQGVTIQTLAEVDRPEVRVLGVADTTTLRAIAAWLKTTTPTGAPDIEEVVARLRDGTADAFGMNRETLRDLAASLPGSRVLDGHFFQARMAVATPQGDAETLAAASAFIEEAKASGLLRRIFDAHGLADQAVAPPATPASPR